MNESIRIIKEELDKIWNEIYHKKDLDKQLLNNSTIKCQVEIEKIENCLNNEAGKGGILEKLLYKIEYLEEEINSLKEFTGKDQFR